MQPTTKLHILQGNIVIGISGPVGLGQLYRDGVERLWKDKKLGFSVSLADVQRLIRSAIFQDAKIAFEGAGSVASLIGEKALHSVVTASLIAIQVGGDSGHPELIQSDHVGASEAATNDLPYVSIGSGQQLADPFLAFLRHIFWANHLPKVADGVFAAVWTLDHAIRVNPGGVTDPIQVVVLSGGKKPLAKELSQEEIQEHRQNVSEAEDFLKSFKEGSQENLKPPPQSPH